MQPLDLPILYQDEALVDVSKPSRLLVHRSKEARLLQGVMAAAEACKESLALMRGEAPHELGKLVDEDGAQGCTWDVPG
jgi:23S rRNA-/tRNA-specific pseudouridylate synthase